jgi:hypothetical protein
MAGSRKCGLGEMAAKRSPGASRSARRTEARVRSGGRTSGGKRKRVGASVTPTRSAAASECSTQPNARARSAASSPR